MSAGHGHSRDNHRHFDELEKLLAEGGAPELMQRFAELDDQHDVTYLAGYNVAGTKRYIDQDVFKALLDPAYAQEVLGGPIDTGMSAEDTIECLLRHEAIEKVLLDADNDLDTYMACHELATAGEHELVRKKGGTPVKYERGLKPAIAFCAKKVLTKVDPDFDCTPYVEHPDKVDRKAIQAMVRLGVEDAGKASKRASGYDRSTSSDQCAGCAHWQGSPDTGPDLSRCDLIAGLVRADRWCKRFEAKGADDGQGDGVPGSESRGSEEPEDTQPGGSGGVGEPQGQPDGQGSEPESPQGEMSDVADSAAQDFSAFGEAVGEAKAPAAADARAVSASDHPRPDRAAPSEPPRRGRDDGAKARQAPPVR